MVKSTIAGDVPKPILRNVSAMPLWLILFEPLIELMRVAVKLDGKLGLKFVDSEEGGGRLRQSIECLSMGMRQW